MIAEQSAPKNDARSARAFKVLPGAEPVMGGRGLRFHVPMIGGPPSLRCSQRRILESNYEMWQNNFEI